MDIEHLEIFTEVAHQGSFAAVARHHDRDASSVSRAIGALEAEMGLRLFQRTTRRVSLTEAGQIFLGRVEPILNGLAEARTEALAATTEPQGNLRMTCSVSFGQQCIVPLLAKFRARFPKISLDLAMTDANLDLVAERIDLAVRLGRRPTGDFIASKLMDTRFRVCASPDYLASHEALNNPEDLKAHNCLKLSVPGFRSHWLFHDGKKSGQVGEQVGSNSDPLSVRVNGDIVISNAMAMRDAAVAGLGPALLAHWLVQENLDRGTLVDIFPDFRVTPTLTNAGVWMVYPSRTFLAQKVRVSLDFFKDSIQRSTG
jgi:DNA-binding transcriptional LysR family regulator